jgi:hypothetical protein
MKNPFLIFSFFGSLKVKTIIKRGSLYIPKENVSKEDYSSTPESCNVRGLGTVFDTCSILGHHLPNNLR